MANVTEVAQWESGIYQLETTDDVIGGASGTSNVQAKLLGNRTGFLKNTYDGVVTKSVAGGADVTLTAAEASNSVLLLTGVITANINVIVPNAGKWIVDNRTTGAFTVTLKTAAGTGVVVSRAIINHMRADGVNVGLVGELSQILADFAIYGAGSDGDVTIASGTTTMTRDMYYNNLTIASGAALYTAGFQVFVKGTLTLNGTAKIHYSGNAGGNASGATGGAAATAPATGGSVGTPGTTGATAGATATTTGAGAQAVALTAQAGPLRCNGGQSNASESGGNGFGTNFGGAFRVGVLAGGALPVNRIRESLLFGASLIFGGSDGAGGGAGGGSGSVVGGGGGGGGAGGGVLYIAACHIVRATTATIESRGGNGGNGANGGSGTTGGGGGGAAGGGGWIYLIYDDASGGSGTFLDATGGTGGNGGNGGSTGNGGSGPAGGYGGRITRINRGAQTITETVGSAGSAGGSASGVTGGAGGAGGACTQVM